jgi:uncharacterized protein
MKSSGQRSASVYSASEFASQEMPDVDVSCAVRPAYCAALARPAGRTGKIDPKSIGVGQYQHDKPERPARSPSAVVEDCVNSVGVT